MTPFNLEQRYRDKTDAELRAVLAGGDTFTDGAKQAAMGVLRERSSAASKASEASHPDADETAADESISTSTGPPGPWSYALTQLAVGLLWLYRYMHASVLDLREHLLIATVVGLSSWAAVSLRARRLTGLLPIVILAAVQAKVWQLSATPWRLQPWIAFDRGGVFLMSIAPSAAILEGILAGILIYLGFTRRREARGDQAAARIST